jgi:transposase
MLMSGMLYILRCGCPWRALPPVFGPWQTVYSRWRLWIAKGVWSAAIKSLSRRRVGVLRFLDASHLKVHQDAHGGPGGKEEQAIGFTRGGSNTKLHALVDGRGRLLRATLTAGQVSDMKIGPELIRGLRHCRIVADKGYDSGLMRETARKSRSRSCIPQREGGKRKVSFHRGYYRKRHHVENFFQRIKRQRRVATRYDKLAEVFFNFILLASTLDWLRS